MYIVFAFDGYYPNGGANDIVLVTESLEDAVDKALDKSVRPTRSDLDFDESYVYDFSQVYSVEEQEVVWDSCKDYQHD